MKKGYFHSEIEGYKVKFTYIGSGMNMTYEAYIEGLDRRLDGKTLKEISDAVRAIIAKHPKA